MRLATLDNGRPDGHLVVVSRDLSQSVSAGRIAPTLQAALDDWQQCHPALEALTVELESGQIASQPFDPAHVLAPLPRAYQWIDGSGYLTHLERVRTLKGSKDAELQSQRPLLYQGGSDRLSAPISSIRVGEGDLAIDFEAEVAVIIGFLPMGADRETAMAAIRLVTVCNDVSLRRLVADDLQRGFGFFHSKPSTAFAPIVATPDALGPAWKGASLDARVTIAVNGDFYGQPNAAVDLTFDFADLIVEAARTRDLGAGTIIGGGTVSNRHDDVLPMQPGGIGFACIAEARVVERIRFGRPRTPFLSAGDVVMIEARDRSGHSLFGQIRQTVEVVAV
jgi:fumarylacetoacetate (FAA) hydrolase